MRNHAPYDAIVGGAFLLLDDGVRLAHSSPLVAEGVLRVLWGRSSLARAMARRMRLPPEGDGVPTRLEVSEEGGVLIWTRDFGRHRVVTRQWAEGPFLVESFGMAKAQFELIPESGSLRYQTVGMRLGAVKVPVIVAPSIEATISDAAGGWHVEVLIRQPGVGVLCHYFGVMELLG